MNEDNLQMGEELRQCLPRINGMAAKLRETHPNLNRAARQQLARKLALSTLTETGKAAVEGKED